MRLLKAFKRIWRIALCDHHNACVSLEFKDSTEIKICTACGRVLWIMDEGDRKHNPHLRRRGY